MATHRATARGHKVRPPLTTGRLALWLLFAFLMACLFLGSVVNLAGKGAGQ